MDDTWQNGGEDFKEGSKNATSSSTNTRKKGTVRPQRAFVEGQRRRQIIDLEYQLEVDKINEE
eukprot:jgi/Psemu1/70755/estExt_Genemark1.C_49300001